MKAAQESLLQRTRDRMARGVEGRSVAYWVWCSPNTPHSELLQRAAAIARARRDMSEVDQWASLPPPFQPGTVVPANNGKWCFTFRDGDGRVFKNQETTFDRAWQAKQAMREFCGLT